MNTAAAKLTPDEADGECQSKIDEWLRLVEAPKLQARALKNSRLTVTEIRCDGPNYGSSDPVIHQDAFVLGLQLRPQSFHELAYDGKSIAVYNGRAGDLLFCDLKAVDAVYTDVPFHSLQFFFSRTFADELADDLEAPRIDEIRLTPGVPVRDALIARLGARVLLALETPQQANELFASHCMLALGVHVCGAYGGLRTPRRFAGALSGWQERLAKEIIEAQLDGGIALEQIAGFCGLSASRFAHAFKSSLGVAPHQWLLQRRIERAKALLKHSRATLAEVALSCGFADQSHFTRVFRRAVGASPGNWKRSFL
jgi:AraC-like DNA-binding protein